MWKETKRLTPGALRSASVSYGWVVRSCLGGLLRLSRLKACLLQSSEPHISFHGRLGVVYPTNTILTFSIHSWMRYAATATTTTFLSLWTFHTFHTIYICNRATPQHTAGEGSHCGMHVGCIQWHGGGFSSENDDDECMGIYIIPEHS